MNISQLKLGSEKFDDEDNGGDDDDDDDNNNDDDDDNNTSRIGENFPAKADK